MLQGAKPEWAAWPRPLPTGKHAPDIASPGDPFDWCRDDSDENFARAGHQRVSIADEGQGEFFHNNRLHIQVLRVKIEHCSITGTRKMNNVQEESLRDRKKSRRRGLMLDTARRIISSKGLISLKVRDVADAAECSIGSVYNEFGDFDGLILTINRETIQRLTEKLRAVPDLDPRAQLHALAAGYLDFAANHANLL